MTIFLVDLESVETRYTSQWKTHLPKLLIEAGHNVHVISGPQDVPSATTPGAFLNFGGTNIYKSRQVEEIARLFCSGSISAGDHFLFADAWHPGIINLKYMSELLNIPVVTHGLWHAGSYDPQDFLGRLIGNKPWVRHAEKSFFSCFDHNYFATEFHVKLFFDNLIHNYPEENPWYEEDWAERYDDGKIVKTGWPMEYMDSVLSPYKNMIKRDLILFPHRIAPEKQVEIFRDLAQQLPQYEFITCQDHRLSKHEYHNLLGQSKIVFSANLQETLGISCYEGALVDAIPMVPNRLSYQEMYHEAFKYPSEWTSSWDHYMTNREDLCHYIKATMEHYSDLALELKNHTQSLTKKFFSATILLNNLK
jgi:glycosyltransferase involved in cell wall biosynthesis